MSRGEKGKAALPNLPASVRKLRCAIYQSVDKMPPHRG